MNANENLALKGSAWDRECSMSVKVVFVILAFRTVIPVLCQGCKLVVLFIIEKFSGGDVWEGLSLNAGHHFFGKPPCRS